MELPDLQDAEPQHGVQSRARHHDHQDPVLFRHDTEGEAGDEVGLADLNCMDTLEAEQRSVAARRDRCPGTSALLGRPTCRPVAVGPSALERLCRR